MKEKILILIAEGLKREEIAELTGASPVYIREIERSLDSYQPTRIDRGKIIALYNAGWRANGIAEDMSIGKDVVKKVLRELKNEGKIN